MDHFVSSKPEFFEFQNDPLSEFLKAFQHAEQAHVPEVNAMSLATVGAGGKPSNRIVLFKGIIRDGFSFYTNYSGRKSRELIANPNAAATFFWPQLSWQIRIEGQVTRLTQEESRSYFHSRPRLSQIGAWASEQSEEIPNHQFFIDKVAALDQKFANEESIPLPPFWGGFQLVPMEIEFWFGHQNRLHERFVFQRPKVSDLWQRFMRSP
jgi:pyridoxamine 5'-phosphate oxidase